MKSFKKVIFLPLIFILCSISINAQLTFYENFVMSPHSLRYTSSINETIFWHSLYYNWRLNYSYSPVPYHFNDSTVNNSGYLKKYLAPIAGGKLDMYTEDFTPIVLSLNSYFEMFHRVPNSNGCSSLILRLYDDSNNIFYTKTYSPNQAKQRIYLLINSTYANKILKKIWLQPFVCHSPSAAYHFFYNISVGNITSSNNTLPILDITNSYILPFCYNKTTSRAYINYTSFITDTENDTIYYSLDMYAYARAEHRKDIDFISSYSCSPDINYFTSSNIVSNNSYAISWNDCINIVNAKGSLCLSAVQFQDYCQGQLTGFNNPYEFYLFSDKVFSVNSSFSERLYMNKNTVHTIKFYESKGKLISNISFNMTNTNITYYINNVKYGNYEYDTRTPIFIYAFFSYDTQQIKYAIGWQNETDQYISGVHTHTINYIDFYSVSQKGYFYDYVHNPLDIVFGIKSYTFEGNFNYIPSSEFELYNGNSIFFNITNFNYLKYAYISVTDNYGLSVNSYNSYVVPYSVEYCEEQIGLTSVDFTKAIEGLRILEYGLCTEFDNIFTAILGRNIYFCNIIIIVTMLLMGFLSISLMVIISNSMRLPFSNLFNLGLLFWSMGMLLLGFVIRYTQSVKVIIAIVLTSSIVIFILQTLFGSGGGGSNE